MAKPIEAGDLIGFRNGCVMLVINGQPIPGRIMKVTPRVTNIPMIDLDDIRADQVENVWRWA